MQAGTLASGVRRGDAYRHGWMPLVLAVAVLVAGCASRTTPAPVTHLSSGEADKPVQTVKPPAGARYTVLPGDTLFSIARRHGVSVESLARLNQIDDPSQLRAGQVLQLSGEPVASRAIQPVVPPAGTKPSGASVTPAESSAQTPATSPSGGAKPSASARSTAAPRARDADLIRWDWPARGRILQGFNVNTKGIDLEGKIGDPVKAAADGTVMYAGNGVRGLGNLILLGHRDGFISAYAHNQVLLVKTGQQIKQGAQIASIGQSDTTSPRLHFEIRRRGTPVNPLSYLPAR